jgi:hypothetical protein
VEEEETLLSSARSYQKAGHLWRSLSLLQFPLAILATFYFITRYLGADTILHVEDIKSIEDVTPDEIPDKEYVNVAQTVFNLLGTFQPTTAREQFETARDFMSEAAERNLADLHLEEELVTAEESGISQIQYLEDYQVTRRQGGEGRVCLYGYRSKIVDQTPLPNQDVTYCFTLKPDDPFEHNPFGLTIIGIEQRLGPQPRASAPRRVRPTFEKAPEPTKGRRSPRKRAKRKAGA